MSNTMIHSKTNRIQVVIGNPKRYRPAQTMRAYLKLNASKKDKKQINFKRSLITKLVLLFIAFFANLQLTGCAQMSINKQDVGVVTGGTIGGLVGSRFGGGSGKLWTTGIGAITGAVIGGMIGHNMDKTDQLQAQMAIEKTRTGQTTSWTNPDNGNHYSVKPIKTYTKSSGQPCREYITTASVGGKQQQVYGTACRQADGAWKVRS